jgi:hypothetical protein
VLIYRARVGLNVPSLLSVQFPQKVPPEEQQAHFCFDRSKSGLVCTLVLSRLTNLSTIAADMADSNPGKPDEHLGDVAEEDNEVCYLFLSDPYCPLSPAYLVQTTALITLAYLTPFHRTRSKR